MRRISVNVILIAGFVLLMGVIALFFTAEIEFARAEKLVFVGRNTDGNW